MDDDSNERLPTDANERSGNADGDQLLAARLAVLARLTERTGPMPGLAGRVSVRIDDRALRRQTAWVLGAAALLAMTGVVFWRMADARLASALTVSATEWEGIEP